MTSLSGCSTWGCAVVGDGVNVCTRFEHDAAGNCTWMALGNGSAVIYAYDALGCLVRETIGPCGKTLAVLTAFCAGIGAGSAFMYLFVRVIGGAVTLTEHISRTRTDIQTLQQLAHPASERHQIQPR
jgi:hypothetical protein